LCPPARRSAKSQARSAETSAAAARRQAEAAEEQLALMRRQFDTDAATADEAAGPVFTVEKAELVISGQRYATATVIMTQGQPLSSITVTRAGKEVLGLVHSTTSQEVVKEIHLTDLAAGGKFTVTAMVDWNASAPVNLTLDMICVERAGKGRTWIRSCTASADEQDETEDNRNNRRRPGTLRGWG
jgi:hypothetical protein